MREKKLIKFIAQIIDTTIETNKIQKKLLLILLPKFLLHCNKVRLSVKKTIAL